MEKVWTTPQFTRVPYDLLNNNPNRPKLEALDILVLSTLCGWTNVEDPQSGHYNWESLETWGKRFGTNKDTAARSFKRLTALGLIANLAIKYQGRTKPLRFVQIGRLREFVNPEAYVEGWPFVTWVDNGNGKRQKKTVYLRGDAASKKLLSSFNERLKLTPPERIKTQVIDKMHAISPRLLWACCIYAGVDPNDYHPLHPMVQESRRKQAQEAADRKAERDAAKKARAKSTENIRRAMSNYNARLPKRQQLNVSELTQEASRCWNYYESTAWQMAGGRHVGSVEDIAGPWINRILEGKTKRQDIRAQMKHERKYGNVMTFEEQTLDVEHEEVD